MVNNYSAMVLIPQLSSGSEGVALSQEEEVLTTLVQKRVKEASDDGTPAQKGDGKPRDKSGMIFHRFQNKGHY